MLKKEYRITSRSDFKEVKEKGEIKGTPLFGLVWMEREGQKFGTIISKKISKKAVERNQIRRRLMEVVRKNMEIFPKDFWGIFLVKKNILGEKTEKIEKCLKKLF